MKESQEFNGICPCVSKKNPNNELRMGTSEGVPNLRY